MRRRRLLASMSCLALAALAPACSLVLGEPFDDLRPAEVGVGDVGVTDATDASDVTDTTDTTDASDVTDTTDTTDTTDSDVPVVDSDAGSCLLAGNLLVNGDFSSGPAPWVPSTCSTASIAGPCAGKGLRVYDATSYGSVGQQVSRVLPAGTKIHARAYFRASGTGGPEVPQLSVYAIGHVDGGEVRAEVCFQNAVLGPSWVAVDAYGTIATDSDGLMVVLTSRNPGADEFAVAAVSLVIE